MQSNVLCGVYTVAYINIFCTQRYCINIKAGAMACGPRPFSVWGDWVSLCSILLSDNKINKIPPRALAGLPNLEWLDLSKNKLDDSSISPDLFQVSLRASFMSTHLALVPIGPLLRSQTHLHISASCYFRALLTIIMLHYLDSSQPVMIEFKHVILCHSVVLQNSTGMYVHVTVI